MYYAGLLIVLFIVIRLTSRSLLNQLVKVKFFRSTSNRSRTVHSNYSNITFSCSYSDFFIVSAMSDHNYAICRQLPGNVLIKEEIVVPDLSTQEEEFKLCTVKQEPDSETFITNSDRYTVPEINEVVTSLKKEEDSCDVPNLEQQKNDTGDNPTEVQKHEHCPVKQEPDSETFNINDDRYIVPEINVFVASLKKEEDSCDAQNLEQLNDDTVDFRGQTFIQNQTLNNHCEVIHQNKSDFNSELREKSSIFLYYLVGISKIHRNMKSYFQCEICKKDFTIKSQLMKHMNLHTNERPFECEFCEKSFKVKYYLSKHLKCHQSERPHQCKICEKGFKSKGELTKHMKLHTNERPFKCELCEKSFKIKSSLMKHLKYHQNERPYQCKICEKGFKSKGELMNHANLHTNETPFKCEICEKSFKVKRYLAIHLKYHQNKIPHQCEICKKGFTAKSLLMNHMNIHRSDKPFKCELCEKAFKVKHYLITHLKVHQKEKPYQCKICEKGFACRNELMNHMNLHTNKRPFKCEFCKKSFKLKKYLATHLKYHKNERPYQCEICKKGFAVKGVLTNHIILHMKNL